MPQYVIEREIPGAGDLGQDDLKGISQKSINVAFKNVKFFAQYFVLFL